MRIISRRRLKEFWERRDCQGAEQPLKAWFREVRKTRWRSPADVKRLYRSADIVGDNRVIFNIGGNKYRLVVGVQYTAGLVFVRFVGTHQEYDEIDATEI